MYYFTAYHLRFHNVWPRPPCRAMPPLPALSCWTREVRASPVPLRPHCPAHRMAWGVVPNALEFSAAKDDRSGLLSPSYPPPLRSSQLRVPA